MLPPPEGVWGMPPELLQTLPGYATDVLKNRQEARTIMEGLGYGPDKKLALTVSTRNSPKYRDPAVILIGQLREIYIDGQLDTVDTAIWFPKSSARTTPSVSRSPKLPSTTLTRSFTKTMRAAPNATTPATAIGSSIS